MTLTFDLPMTLTLDFQGQIFQLLYFRNGLSAGHDIKGIQDCFLQKEARVCVSNAFVLEDSMYK